MFVFVTGVGIPPPVEFGVRICSDMHFWGSCGVLKVAMAQLEMPAGYSDICFWYVCLGTCLPLLLATSHFYLAQFWCSCGDGFFPNLFYCNDRGHAYHFGHAISKRGRCSCWCRHHSIGKCVFFFQSVRTQDVFKIFFAAAWVKLRMAIGATRPREIQK